MTPTASLPSAQREASPMRRAYKLAAGALAVLFLISLGAFSAAQAQHYGTKVGGGEGGGGSRGGGGGIGGAATGIAIGIGTAIILNEAAKAAEKNKKKKKKATPVRATRKKPVRKKKQVRQVKKKPAPALRVPVAVPDFADGEILLAFAPGTSDADINQFVLQFGLTPISDTRIAFINTRILRASMPGGLSAARALQIANDPRVVAQPNYLYTPAQNTAQSAPQYALAKLGVPKAHETSQGQGVLVAVIDSGVNSSHPALAGAVVDEYTSIDAKATPDTAHGTAVASIIAARNGMTSVAPQAQIISVTAFARDKKFGRTLANTFDLLKGIDYAVSKNAKILNLSFAGPRDPLMQNTLAAAGRKGIVVVAAAGNKGPKAPPAYPGAYRNVIAATATDAKDQLYKEANRGDYVAIAAPGVDVFAAGTKNGYGLNSGTSMAAAYVSGSVALMLQTRPQLSSEAVVKRLADSAKDLGDSGKDPVYGYGLIDVAKAVNGN